MMSVGMAVQPIASVCNDDEIRALAGFLAESLVGDDERRTGDDQVGNLIDHIFGNFDAGERLLWRFFHGGRSGDFAFRNGLRVLRCANLVKSSLGLSSRLLGRQRDHVPAKARAVIGVFQRREDMSTEALLGMIDLDRSIEQRQKILAHINLFVFATDKDRDRSMVGRMIQFSRLGWRQRDDFRFLVPPVRPTELMVAGRNRSRPGSASRRCSVLLRAAYQLFYRFRQFRQF